jgi:hypothetical protein
MLKNDVLTLIQDIARDQAEDDTISKYYDEAIVELGKLPDPVLVERELFTVTAATATYDYPAAAIELLHMFRDTDPLLKTTRLALEQRSKAWREDSGTPVSYNLDNETADTFRLYPIPDTTSTALGIGATEPFGDDFPANMGATIHSDSRETGISDMIGLYVAFRVLYKEFHRPSDHQDIEWAMLHKAIAQLLFYMGVMRDEQRKSGKAPTAT